MHPVFLNRIGTANPVHEVHGTFRAFAEGLIPEGRERRLFSRMADRAGIQRRWSVLEPDGRPRFVDAEGFYESGRFPSTRERMLRWEA